MNDYNTWLGFLAIALLVWNGSKVLVKIVNLFKQDKSFTMLYNMVGIFLGCIILYVLPIKTNNQTPEKNKTQTLDPEYYLEILNQNTIKIQPIGENKTYTCKPNQIDSVLTVDNL